MYSRRPLLLRSARARAQLRESERGEARAADDDRAAQPEGGAGAQQALQRRPRPPGAVRAAHGTLRPRPRPHGPHGRAPLARALLRERNRCVRA